MTATPSDDQSRQGEAATKPKMHGLWAVMQPVAAESPPTETAPTSVADSAPSEPAPRGLWSLMEQSVTPDVPAPPAIEEELEPLELVESADAHPPTVIPGDPSLDADSPVEIATEAPSEDALGTEFEFASGTTVRPPSRGWQALWLGLIALPLSVTAWFGLFWPAVITASCGFGALILAAAEWTASGPVNLAERRKVTVGAIAGALAIVLGPYVFSPLGLAARDARSGRNTQRHLQQIGTALQQFHQQESTFPIGGTVLRDAEGRSRGGHSWMAAILPLMGEQTLYRRIDMAQAYDEPANRPAMSTPVNAYFAAGGNRAANGGGYAVAHFSGVGGEVRALRGGETQAAGIFRSGIPLAMADVTDGLATTFTAGEIDGPYPAWGDPENLRVPGLGLNKDARGFGNAARTGAMMLFADGHVKFFPNATDAEVLRRLSTRNAGDLTAGVD